MNSRRSGWKLTLPPPHGHSPAMARTSVLFPEPDSPATSSRSPGSTVASASSTTRVAAARSVAALGALQSMEQHHHRGDAPRAGLPAGKPRIIVDQPAERGLH